MAFHSKSMGTVTHGEMAERLHQEMWRSRRQRLEALLIRADLNQQQHDPPQPDNMVDPQLFSVAKEGNVDKFIKALEDHCAKERVSLPVHLGLRSPLGNTLLHAAAESDDNVRAIIDFVPKHLISCKNSREETPLHIAARAGKSDAVELLLPWGKPTCTGHSGNSALHEAVRNRGYEVIRQLVNGDPNLVYSLNKESKSPWYLAVETGDLNVLKVLLNAPNDAEDQRRSESERIIGMSPVHLAITSSNMDMLKAMWETEPWLFQLRDAGGGRPLHLAAYGNYLVAVRFLIEKCPSSALEQDGTYGYLPIHVACMRNHLNIVKELLRQWPDPAEFSTSQGQNILHVSARYGSIETVRYILKNPKFNHLINARDFNGNTPLHLAALHCQPSVMLLARNRRVDVKLVNMNNMTALDVVDQDIKEIFGPLRNRLTRIVLASAGTPIKRELVFCQPTGRSPRQRLEPPQPDIIKSGVETLMVVAGLMASVTFTSGVSVPGGYNSSYPDAGIPLLLHKAMFNVFVISNSVAMYSSIMALVILLWTHINDPYVMGTAILLLNLPLLITLAAMPLAFMAGVYVSVTKLTWLSIFTLALGAVALFITLSVFILMFLPLGCRHPLIHCFPDRLIFVGLCIARREAAGSRTAERAAKPSQGTADNNLRPRPEE